MLKLIIGVRGTGKTKQLIELTNTAADISKGSVVCVEKGDKLRYDIKSQVRLIDSNRYHICSASELYGFISGMIASNHDITDLFVDSTLKICNSGYSELDELISKVAVISDELGINCVMTASMPIEDATDTMKLYI